MTLVAVLLLAILWGAVFVPALVRARQNASPIATVSSFRRGMRALGTGPGNGRWVLVPKGPEELEEPRRRALARRRRVFAFLVLSAAATGLLGLIPTMRDLLKLHVAADLFLGAYVFFLLQLKHRQAEADLDFRDQPHAEDLQSDAGSEEEYLRAEHF